MQHECIPQAILGMDVICQAKSGMGKTAVFVLSTLQQIEPVAGQVAALVLCHTRELAYQVCHIFGSKALSTILSSLNKTHIPVDAYTALRPTNYFPLFMVVIPASVDLP